MKPFQKYIEALSGGLADIQCTSSNAAPCDLEQGCREAVQQIMNVREIGRKVIFIGNGGSAAIASHQAVDLWKNGGIRAVSFNDASLLTCISNDYGYEHVFEKPIEMFAEGSDLVIAISSSGQSKNILRAVDCAAQLGCEVITLSGFKPDNPLRRKGKLNFYVPSDSYGVVEISHLVICHYFVDQIIAQNESQTSQSPKPFPLKAAAHG